MMNIIPVHLLLAVVEIFLKSKKNSACGKIVREMGITPDEIRKIVSELG
jgi:hypothetical protein